MGKWLGNTPKFQSTLRRTERHLAEILDSILVEFQSTLRRTERHEVISGKYGNEPISIHAPTNGATVLCGLSYHRLIYFNPRSDERSDVVKCGVQYRGCAFQSTLRRTERHSSFRFLGWYGYFNPRSDERSDPKPPKFFPKAIVFQSTLRRTERLSQPTH